MTVHHLKTAYCHSCRLDIHPPRIAGDECPSCAEFKQDERDTDLAGIEDLLETDGRDAAFS